MSNYNIFLSHVPDFENNASFSKYMYEFYQGSFFWYITVWIKIE
jgi:hypothetical protein